MYFVYVIRCKGGSLYTGIAKDVDERFKAHRAGEGARYTRAYPPDRIIYIERKLNKSNALRREAEIKKMTRAEKLKLIRRRELAGRKKA